jgi:uncharacterized protein (DUF934 family)
MTALIKNRAVMANEWAVAGTDAAASASRVLLPLADYLKAAAAGEPLQQRGILLKPEDLELAPLLPHLHAVPVIAMYFGSSGEGRGYSQARLLRERHGYKGELRAIGKVMVDQIYLMARCGFDAFELADGEDVAAALAQFERFTVAYQPGMEGLTHPRRRYGN